MNIDERCAKPRTRHDLKLNRIGGGEGNKKAEVENNGKRDGSRWTIGRVRFVGWKQLDGGDGTCPRVLITNGDRIC